MSIIVAIKNRNKICIACDGQLTYGNEVKQLGYIKYCSSNNWTCGVVGAYRFFNIIENEAILKRDINKENLYEWIEDLKKLMIDKAGLPKCTDNPDGVLVHPIDIILVFDESIYQISGSYTFKEIESSYCSIGSAKDFTNGFLCGIKADNRELDTDSAIKAIQGAIEYDIYCGGKIFHKEWEIL